MTPQPDTRLQGIRELVEARLGIPQEDAEWLLERAAQAEAELDALKAYVSGIEAAYGEALSAGKGGLTNHPPQPSKM